MYNFDFFNPVHLYFGKGQIAQLATILPKDKKIMVTFGGGSVKRNGVYDQVVSALKGFDFIEFWGIEPNPQVSTVREAVAKGKAEKVGFLLAVGGGSVLDATKLIAGAIESEDDAWDIVKRGYYTKSIPLGTVLTLPATGSEMNQGGVISNKETNEKLGFFGIHPVFSVLDPEVVKSLPARQISLGLADSFVHVIEQYLTVTGESILMDRWAESVLQSIVEIAPKLVAGELTYDNCANFMLCATMALNGFIAMGVSQDWATHMIGHELTALHGVSHGASLAIVLPAMMRTLAKQKEGKILQYGERVWGVLPESGTVDERVALTIDKTEQFFRSLNLSTRLSEENIGVDTIEEIARRFTARKVHYGEGKNVDGNMARRVLNNALI